MRREQATVGQPLVRVRTEFTLDGSALTALGAAALCSALLLDDRRDVLLFGFAIQAVVLGCVLSALHLRRLRGSSIRSAPSGAPLEDEAATMRRVSLRLLVIVPVIVLLTLGLEELDPGRPPTGIVAGSLVGAGLAYFLAIGWVARWERENDLLLLFHRRRLRLPEPEAEGWDEQRTFYSARPGSLQRRG